MREDSAPKTLELRPRRKPEEQCPLADDDSARRALAHVRPDGAEHELLEHLRGVGALASTFAATFGGAEQAELVVSFERPTRSRITRTPRDPTR
jgi:hypothetical protein